MYTSTSDGESIPFENLSNKRPDLSNVKVFEALLYVHISKAKL